MYTHPDLPESPLKAHEFLTSAEMWCQESPAKDAHGNKRSAVMDQVLRALSVSEGGRPVWGWWIGIYHTGSIEDENE